MNIRRVFFAVIVFAITALMAVSCTAPFSSSESCVHRDINKDFRCDRCGEATVTVCTSHIDRNHDGVCDSAGCFAALSVLHTDTDCDGECDECYAKTETQHIDGDDDGKCDRCSLSLKVECEHTDSDTNGVCDLCGEELSISPECEHCDENLDGRCDGCKGAIEGAIALIKDGRLQYKLVLSLGNSGRRAQLVDMLSYELNSKFGLGSEVVADKADTVTEYEIIFGNSASRGEEYHLEPHDYGMKGFAIKIIGTKIVVVDGGSDEAFEDSLDALREKILGIADGKAANTRFITEKNSIISVQDDYKVGKITLFDEDIRDFVIVAEAEGAEYKTAKMLCELLYEKSGYWLPIKEKAEGKGSIIIALTEKTGGLGFYADFEEGKMTFASEYSNSLFREVQRFFTLRLSGAAGTLDLAGDDSYEKNVRDVYYSDFGAKGDGETDDLAAIIAAHEYANDGGHHVFADEGATYYIGNNGGNNHYKGAVIQTDTTWTGAKFIIDDSAVSSTALQNGIYARMCEIFSIKPSRAAIGVDAEEISIDSLMRGDKRIGYAPGFKAVVLIKNTNQKNYIRYGLNANSGAIEQEVVLVDENGFIDESTPLMWDYETISGYTVYYVDEEPITVTGGNFTTVYNRGENVYTPYSRGIWVRRSNVTVRDVSHVNIGEGDTGCPSGGFTVFRGCYNVLFENIEYDNMKSFYEEKNGQSVLMGSYEIAGQQSIGVTWKNCTQLDFWRDEEKRYAASGGIMGTSYNRDLTFDGCTLSSFDAHAGVYNVTIKNSEIEHINCIGGGEARIENTRIHTMYQKNAINLRSDYGSLWMGDFYFIDCTLITEKTHEVALFDVAWYNHDFGFDFGTSMPTRVFVENITIDSEDGLNVLKLVEQHVGRSSSTAEKIIWTENVWEATVDGAENVNPYRISEEWIIKDDKGYYYLMPPAFTTGLSIERKSE